RMAPLDQYLMTDRNAEIALARTAAPKSISADATVMALGRHGYETAVKGTNGFVCIVERSWMSPFDDPGFWSPKNRSPICYNPVAARSVLPYTFKRTELVMAGLTKPQMLEQIKAAVAKKELPTPEPGAMSYMLSKESYLNDQVGHWVPHLMFHIPKTDPRYVSDADVARYAKSYAAPEHLHAAFEVYRAFPANEKFNAEQQSRIDVPLVLAIGSKSVFLKDLPTMAKALRAHGCTNVKTRVIEGSSHYVADERPETLGELIEEYASVRK